MFNLKRSVAYRVLLPLLTLVSAAVTVSCVGGKLTTTTETSIAQAELAACDYLSTVFGVSGIGALACPGSEVLLEDALNTVTATAASQTADAGTATRSKSIAEPPTAAVRFRHRVIGFVPPSLRAQSQAFLTAVESATGASTGGATDAGGK
jgi:hypothetical protein